MWLRKPGQGVNWCIDFPTHQSTHLWESTRYEYMYTNHVSLVCLSAWRWEHERGRGRDQQRWSLLYVDVPGTWQLQTQTLGCVGHTNLFLRWLYLLTFLIFTVRVCGGCVDIRVWQGITRRDMSYIQYGGISHTSVLFPWDTIFPIYLSFAKLAG